MFARPHAFARMRPAAAFAAAPSHCARLIQRTGNRPLARAAATNTAAAESTSSSSMYTDSTSEPKPDTYSEPLISADDELTPTMHAFVARTGLEFTRHATLLQAITDVTFRGGRAPSNEKLEFLGNKITELLAAEWAHSKYPHIFPEGLRDIVAAYCGVASMTQLGRTLGVQDIVRWNPGKLKSANYADVVARATTAIIGGFYHDRGIIACSRFVRSALMAHEIDVKAITNISEPRRTLFAILRRKGMEPSMCRLLHETGRFSAAPIFVVGVFSGLQKLGEGVGSSLRMAETRAYKDALLKYFLYDVGKPILPSEAAELPTEEQLLYRGTELGETPRIAQPRQIHPLHK